MKRSVGVTVAALSFLPFSAVLLSFSYYIVTDNFPILDSEDRLFLSFGTICGLVASWSLVTMVGILRLRAWARNSALWLAAVAGLIYVPPLGWYVHGVIISRDVGWNWAAIIPLAACLGLTVWWLRLFTRPGVKHQFGALEDVGDSAAPERRKTV